MIKVYLILLFIHFTFKYNYMLCAVGYVYFAKNR